MSIMFAVTSFFVALSNSRDQLHSKATALAERLDSQVLTTEYILVEFGNFLRRPDQRAVFLEAEREIRRDELFEVLPANRFLYDQGLALYAKRLDKSWSLTDCISFVVMEQYHVVEALTADRHFEQAGFVALLV